MPTNHIYTHTHTQQHTYTHFFLVKFMPVSALTTVHFFIPPHIFFIYFILLLAFSCLQTVGWIEGVVWTDPLHIGWAVTAAIWGSHQGSCSWEQRAQDGEWTTWDQSTKVRSISRIQLGCCGESVFTTAGLALSDCHERLICEDCTVI